MIKTKKKSLGKRVIKKQKLLNKKQNLKKYKNFLKTTTKNLQAGNKIAKAFSKHLKKKYIKRKKLQKQRLIGIKV